MTGQLIKQILKERGLKMSWLAKKLKISNSTLASRLNSDLKVSFLIEVCGELNISINDVFTRYIEN